MGSPITNEPPQLRAANCVARGVACQALRALPWPCGILACIETTGTPPVSEPPSDKPAGRHGDRRSLFGRLVELVSPGPDTRAGLIKSLAEAEHRELIAPDSRLMLEGVIRMADMTAADVMVPATRMDLLDIDAPYDELLAQVIATGHSRFPVHDGPRDNIIGILMAKDLLKLQRAPELNLRTLLRPAVFVPESKNLNELLRAFRSNRNHLAIAIDEFGNTAGLVTIEDVLEEIVGEIEDEFDDAAGVDDRQGIYTLADGSFRVDGDTPIVVVNQAFGVALPEADFDTIGGLVAQEHGRVPRRGESVRLAGLAFVVMLTRGGAVRWFRVARVAGAASEAEGA
ncbi:MAG: CBS domain-containing protein [Burkholderiales bacterium]|nr:CBS domain-containing protein [Burkholderiales bacterium]